MPSGVLVNQLLLGLYLNLTPSVSKIYFGSARGALKPVIGRELVMAGLQRTFLEVRLNFRGCATFRAVNLNYDGVSVLRWWHRRCHEPNYLRVWCLEHLVDVR